MVCRAPAAKPSASFSSSDRSSPMRATELQAGAQRANGAQRVLRRAGIEGVDARLLADLRISGPSRPFGGWCSPRLEMT